MGFIEWLKGRQISFDTIQSIRAIPVPVRKETKYHDVKKGMEYILQRKATEHKKNGRMDLAIECLRKSNELMPYSFFEYTRKDYERLVNYLRAAKRFEEADQEEKKLNQKFGSKEVLKSRQKKCDVQFLKEAKELNTDLVEMSTHHPTCGECAMYQGRVFSIGGKDKHFPKLPDVVLKTGKVHPGCRHTFNPYFKGVSTPNNGVMDIQAFSNRPFIDERSDEEKLAWTEWETKVAQEKKDRVEYAWLQQHCPDMAPKSFGGYRKMKSSNSNNYQNLMRQAHEIGYKE